MISSMHTVTKFFFVYLTIHKFQEVNIHSYCVKDFQHPNCMPKHLNHFLDPLHLLRLSQESHTNNIIMACIISIYKIAHQ